MFYKATGLSNDIHVPKGAWCTLHPHPFSSSLPGKSVLYENRMGEGFHQHLITCFATCIHTCCELIHVFGAIVQILQEPTQMFQTLAHHFSAFCECRQHLCNVLCRLETTAWFSFDQIFVWILCTTWMKTPMTFDGARLVNSCKMIWLPLLSHV